MQYRRHATLLLGSAAVGAIAAVTACYRRDMRAVRARLDSLNSQILRTDSGSIEYVRSGAGYPLLVVHGALGGVDQGVWLAERIGPRRDELNCDIVSVS